MYTFFFSCVFIIMSNENTCCIHRTISLKSCIKLQYSYKYNKIFFRILIWYYIYFNNIIYDLPSFFNSPPAFTISSNHYQQTMQLSIRTWLICWLVRATVAECIKSIYLMYGIHIPYMCQRKRELFRRAAYVIQNVLF